MKFRTGLLIAAIAGATLAGGAIAQATPSQDPASDATPDWTEICESVHGDWSTADWQEMDRLMEEYGFEGMDEYMHGQGFEGMDEYMHGGDSGHMGSMMGGGAGWGA
jgi:hypothetical protein